MIYIQQISVVAIGGALGSVLRFLCNLIVHQSFTNFPSALSTNLVNVIGCFLFGLGSVLFKQFFEVHPLYAIFFLTGFCGGFTTFSAFTADSVTLFQNQQWGLFYLHYGVHLFVGILAMVLGQHCGLFLSSIK